MIFESDQIYVENSATNLAVKPDYLANEQTSTEEHDIELIKGQKIIYFDGSVTLPFDEAHPEVSLFSIKKTTFAATAEPQFATIIVPFSDINEISPIIYAELEDLHSLAKSEFSTFKEVVAFPDRLEEFVETYSIQAIEAISFFINSNQTSTEVIAEMLSVVGRSKDFPSRKQRRKLLLRCLNMSSPQIKFGACMGLLGLRDVSTVPFVNEAISSESLSMVRHMMIQVKNRLEHKT